MRHTILAFLFITALARFSFTQDTEGHLMRFPAIHGDQIVFSYAGDLYTVSKEGGTARKLTSDTGYEMFPRFSPDGKRIAFTGQYDGNTEVFVIPAQGGVPVRLTYTATLDRDDVSDRMGPNNIVMTWKDNEHIVFRTRKNTWDSFKGELYVASVTGGLPEPLPFSVGGFCSYSPDGKKIAMNRIFREFRTWKYYRGGMADDIYIFDFASKKWEDITNNDAQDIEPMWHGDKIYYLSDRDRIMNLFAYDTVTKQTSKLTNYTDFDIKFASLGDQSIVFEKGGDLYSMDLQTQQATKTKVFIPNDELWSRSELLDASAFIESFQLSPDGKRLLLVARGDVFTVPAESGITRDLDRTSTAHERNAVWSPDAKWIAYTSDVSGEDEIYIRPQMGGGVPTQITSNGDSYKYQIRWSPDSKKLLWSDRKFRLQYVDVTTKQITQIEQSNVFEYRSYNWSPDSQWIAFIRPELDYQNRAFLYSLQTKTSTPVTDGWYTVNEPTFSRDGKYLMLTSDRDFNPTFSNVEFQIAYVNMTKVYLIPLSKATPSPFAPEDNEVQAPSEKPAGAEKKTDDKKTDADKKKEETKPKTPEVKVDLDGIVNRLVALPTEASAYFNIDYVDGNVYYQKQKQGEEKPSVYVYKIKDKKEDLLGTYDDYQISADASKMVVVSVKGKDRTYSIVDLPKGKIEGAKNVDLSGMKILVNKKEEYRAIFNECWRQMRDFFYAPNMNGVDWNAMKTKYGALIPYVNHRADLTYIIGEMIGELSIGHTYVGGGDKPEPKRIKVGLLGAILEKDASGYFKTTKILAGGNWSKSLRSPLTEVGVNVNTGDYILAVNGAPTNQMTDIYASLVNQDGRQVELTVNTKPSMEGSRKVIVVPIADESPLVYYNWVQKNVDYVNAKTNGKVGYLHIPDMSVDGLNEFISHFYPQINKKALIIDVRSNGGGFVSALVAERLARQLVFFNITRYGTGTPDPQMLLGPKVLIADQYSASDGDIITYRFKKYQLGKVIGRRTWGGVTGIRNSLPLIDGGFLNRPEFASYDEKGWPIEGHGVEPDITVDQDPALEYLGTDQQLDKAIEVILDELKTKEQKVPPVPNPPDRTHGTQ